MNGLQGHMFLECINLAENDVSATISYTFYNFYLLQIIDLKEILHVVNLRMLRVLNLKHNPVEVVIQCWRIQCLSSNSLKSLGDYRLSIVYKIPQLKKLDHIQLTPQDKVD